MLKYSLHIFLISSLFFGSKYSFASDSEMIDIFEDIDHLFDTDLPIDIDDKSSTWLLPDFFKLPSDFPEPIPAPSLDPFVLEENPDQSLDSNNSISVTTPTPLVPQIVEDEDIPPLELPPTQSTKQSTKTVLLAKQKQKKILSSMEETLLQFQYMRKDDIGNSQKSVLLTAFKAIFSSNREVLANAIENSKDRPFKTSLQMIVDDHDKFEFLKKLIDPESPEHKKRVSKRPGALNILGDVIRFIVTGEKDLENNNREIKNLYDANKSKTSILKYLHTLLINSLTLGSTVLPGYVLPPRELPPAQNTKQSTKAVLSAYKRQKEILPLMRKTLLQYMKEEDIGNSQKFTLLTVFNVLFSPGRKALVHVIANSDNHPFKTSLLKTASDHDKFEFLKKLIDVKSPKYKKRFNTSNKYNALYILGNVIRFIMTGDKDFENNKSETRNRYNDNLNKASILEYLHTLLINSLAQGAHLKLPPAKNTKTELPAKQNQKKILSSMKETLLQFQYMTKEDIGNSQKSVLLTAFKAIFSSDREVLANAIENSRDRPFKTSLQMIVDDHDKFEFLKKLIDPESPEHKKKTQ